MNDGTFEERINRVPKPYGEAEIEEWLCELKPAYPRFCELVANASSSSPYLNSLISNCRDWLGELPDCDPLQALDDICSDVDEFNTNSAIFALRTRKRRLALLVALADLGGVWDLGQVTDALTRFADLAVNSVLKSLVHSSMRRGRIECREDCDQDFGGIFVLAMGKMGARELNYSSDIDLIVLFDEHCHDLAKFQFVRAEYIRITRRLAKLLSEITAHGYVFRTDLRLRPDPLVNPVCMSVGGAERYYESFGRNWERAAFIKARVCAGNLKAGERFLESIRPFVWRRNLDFAAVQDANDMRLRIQKAKGAGNLLDLGGYSLKLGRGGIREIELFVQTYQMISGGRHRSLRVPQTLGILPILAEEGWIGGDTSELLQHCYRRLRELEHRSQMIRDAQTHEVPRNTSEQERMAALSGHNELDAFLTEVRDLLQGVHGAIEKCLPSRTSDEVASEEVSFLTDTHREMIARWRDLPAFRTQRATEIFSRLQPVILSRMEQAANPGEALFQFDGFLKGLPAGVQLFSLFESNPLLMRLLADTCATAPRLARYLSQHASVFDAVLDGHFFDPLAPKAQLMQELREILRLDPDFEMVLRNSRKWMHEHQFRIGVHHLRDLVDPSQIASIYSDLAEAVLGGIWPRVVGDFSKRHGPPPGRGAAIVAMGSLGAESLTCQSDLDLLLIYDAQNQERSEGKRSLPSKLYFARLTQALVSALSAPMAEGALYSIDMRLRPSGRQGPVATSFESFRHYQFNDAWTWEHLALTRARVVAGNPELASDLEVLRRQIIDSVDNQEKVLHDLVDMRRRLAENLPTERASDAWELRLGKGRLLDIDLVAQTGALLISSRGRSVTDQLADASEGGWMSVDDAEVLHRTHDTLSRIRQATRLTSEGRFSPDTSGTGALQFLLHQTGDESIEELAARLHDERAGALSTISGLLERHGAA
ncbi:MAG: glutamine-synthetase adenylyltransferase [Rhodobacteraceae bacterium]|nr:glutamine-synthetase adenylyltransferase [Paracoccaceae bacterium]